MHKHNRWYKSQLCILNRAPQNCDKFGLGFFLSGTILPFPLLILLFLAETLLYWQFRIRSSFGQGTVEAIEIAAGNRNSPGKLLTWSCDKNAFPWRCWARLNMASCHPSTCNALVWNNYACGWCQSAVYTDCFLNKMFKSPIWKVNRLLHYKWVTPRQFNRIPRT